VSEKGKSKKRGGSGVEVGVGGGGDGCGRLGVFSTRGRSKNTREPRKGREKGLGRNGRREENKTIQKTFEF